MITTSPHTVPLPWRASFERRIIALHEPVGRYGRQDNLDKKRGPSRKEARGQNCNGGVLHRHTLPSSASLSSPLTMTLECAAIPKAIEHEHTLVRILQHVMAAEQGAAAGCDCST